MRRARTKPAGERRADLLAAGRALFLAKGIAATSPEDITSTAGCPKGLFYLYFRSKEDLLLGLPDEFSAEFAGRIRGAVAAEADWTIRLGACVRVSFEYYRDRLDLHEILFHHAVHDAGQHRHEPLVAGVIADLLTEGAAAGAFDAADPKMTAVLCYTSMRAFDPGFHGGGGELADERLRRAAQEFFRRSAGVR